MKSARRVRALSARRMWLVIWSLVMYHELFCEPEQLLSEGVDRALEKHPVLVYSFVAVTVAHLLNRLPTRVDPYTWGLLITKKGIT